MTTATQNQKEQPSTEKTGRNISSRIGQISWDFLCTASITNYAKTSITIEFATPVSANTAETYATDFTLKTANPAQTLKCDNMF